MTIKPRLIVTGGNGFVAGHVLAAADDRWDVHILSRQGPPDPQLCERWHSFKNTPEARALLRELSPRALIHTAAIADIDFAGKNRPLAWEANVGLTKALAEECAEIGCKMVFCSTDTVFDGEHAPYDEQSATGPVNYYAETKVEAEKQVAALGSRAVIARLALVVGLPIFHGGNSFLAKTIASMKAGREIIAPSHEVRSPVDVLTASRALLELADGDHHGIYHLAGHTRINRWEMMKVIANRFGFPQASVIAQPPGLTPGRAARPRDVSLDNAKVSAQLKTPMLTLDEGLSLVLATAT